MLVLSRNRGESLIIGEDRLQVFNTSPFEFVFQDVEMDLEQREYAVINGVKIQCVKTGRNSVRIGIIADNADGSRKQVMRGELCDIS